MAKLLAQHAHAMYLRVDTVEIGLNELCGLDVGAEGYELSYRVAQTPSLDYS